MAEDTHAPAQSGPVVAELGRPETPAETAARKAETSRKHRANQTMLNLVVALIASLAIVLFLVVVVVRPEPAPSEGVDVAQTAQEAQGGAEHSLIVPALPEGWYANSATFQKRSEILTWYVGYVTPSTQFIALNQGIEANPSWQSTVLNEARSTGSVTIDGLTWDVYDQRTTDKPGNYAYAMSTTIDGSTLVLHGTAETPEFELLAASIAAEVSP